MVALTEVLIILAAVGVGWVGAIVLSYMAEAAFVLAGTKHLRASWAFALFCLLITILMRPWPAGLFVWILFVPLFTPRTRRHRG